MKVMIMSRMDIVKGIYTKPAYLAVNAAAAVIYYYVYEYILSIQTHGIAINLPPSYLVYLLVITSSVLLTIAIYSIRNSRNNQAKISASVTGSFTAVFGGILGGCGCTSPLLFGILGAVGLGSQFISFDMFFIRYQIGLLAAFILINVLLATYYVNRLSNPKCAIKRRGNERRKTQNRN